MWVETHKNVLPVMMWPDSVEPEAMRQLYNLARLPFAYKWIAAMPDCHVGYGMPIGGVFASVGAIIPNAVGYDIGCGMCAVKTSLLVEEHLDNKRAWQDLVNYIRQNIPVGRNHHKQMQDKTLMPVVGGRCHKVAEQYDSARRQLGTLGGGNHFIEVQKGSDGHFWIMIHSGSRNVGKQVAEHHNAVAKDLNRKWHAPVPPSAGLAYLPLGTEEGQTYMEEMQWCVAFAKRSRHIMMETVLSFVSDAFDIHPGDVECSEPQWHDVAHNYAAMEYHYGKNVLVHRKGATRARKDEIGIIPGSMGTYSYIVKGLGNPKSFHSCSHGAGRPMSRTEAKDTLDLIAEQKKMEGIIHNMKSRGDLDEAPGAYKDIQTVMEQQADLVTPVVELTPIAVVKG